MIVIELSGMPRAGKSSHMEILESRLKDKEGKLVRCIHEGIKFCPLDKRDVFAYTTWSFHYTANAIMEARSMPFDYILIDRGIYDHLAFAVAYYASDALTEKQYISQKNYFYAFKELEHLVFTFLVSPETSLERRRKIHLYNGRVMNASFLQKLSAAYHNIREQASSSIPHVFIDAEQPFEVNTELIMRRLALA